MHAAAHVLLFAFFHAALQCWAVHASDEQYSHMYASPGGSRPVGHPHLRTLGGTAVVGFSNAGNLVSRLQLLAGSAYSICEQLA